MIKSTLLAAVAALGLATTAMASDFDNTRMQVTTKVEQFEFKLDASIASGEKSSNYGMAVGVHTFEHQVGVYDANVYFEIGYANVADIDTAFTYAEYQMIAPIGGATSDWDTYVNFELAYLTPTADLSSGDFFFTPEVGVIYAASPTTDLWAEIDYGFNASESFDNVGGKMEIGADFRVTDTIDLSPSILTHYEVENFDLNDTQFKLEMTLNF